MDARAAEGAAVGAGAAPNAEVTSWTTGSEFAGSHGKAPRPGSGSCGICAAVGRARPSMADKRAATLVI